MALVTVVLDVLFHPRVELGERLAERGRMPRDRRRCAASPREGKGTMLDTYPVSYGDDTTSPVSVVMMTYVSSSSSAARCRSCLMRCSTSACKSDGF